MKRLIILSIAVAFLSTSFITPPANTNNEKGVQFQNITFQQALSKARQQHKYVFMNVYAVWCAPCKLLKKTTFESEKVGQVINKSFISIDVDAEKGEGVSLAKRYEIKAHPLMLVINSDGKVEKRILGYMDEAQLLEQVKAFAK